MRNAAPVGIVVGMLLILVVVIVCTLPGCVEGPEIEAPGKPVDAVETTHDGWKPVSTWTLAEMSPGVWFIPNTALYGDGTPPAKQQFINALTTDGQPISFRCDGGAVKLKAIPDMSPDGKAAVATLIMYTKTDGDNEYTRYELSYPKRGL